MRERAKCGACGADVAKRLFDAADPIETTPGETFTVGRCGRCGHVYVVDRPPATDIGRYYPPDYEPHRCRGSEEGRASSRRHRRIRVCGPARVLDVGCGSGYDLLRFRSNGCDLYGIETDPEAAEEARRHKIVVRNCSIEEADFPTGHFHIITMFYVLEHLHDPRRAMANLRRMLHPDGEAHLIFPTADGITFSLFQGDWYHLDVPRHLQFFTHRSFLTLCANVGLRVVYRGCRSGGRGVRRSVGAIALRHPMMNVLGRVLRWRVARWATRATMKLVVDALRLGEVAEYVLRANARAGCP